MAKHSTDIAKVDINCSLPCYNGICIDFAGIGMLNVLGGVLPIRPTKVIFAVSALWICRPYTWLQTGEYLLFIFAMFNLKWQFLPVQNILKVFYLISK